MGEQMLGAVVALQYHSRMAELRSVPEWCSAKCVRLVGADIVSPK